MKTYQMSEPMLLLIMQRLRGLTNTIEGVDGWIKDIENAMREQDRLRPYMRPGMAEVKDVLDNMFQTMERKGHDYSGTEHTFTSFERAAEFAGVNPEIAFLILMGVKVSRITSLTRDDLSPENEALMDSFIDLANYVVLYQAYQKYREGQQQS